MPGPETDLHKAVVISAYVAMFDDWQLLGAALQSIDPLVDEIVVVDGAYEWIAPYLPAGRDPARSDPRVYEALAPFARKTRVIEGVWRDELHKRTAGYEACRGRWVLRADADEIVFPNADWERFLASGSGVGMTYLAVHTAPGWIQLLADVPPTHLAVLFDRSQVSAEEHLGYLWIINAERARAAQRPEVVFPAPIAHHAHLTGWRPPETAVSRARFYILNHARQTGDNPGPLDEALLTYPMVVEPDSHLEGWFLQPSPLLPEQEARLAGPYAEYVAGLQRITAGLADGRRIDGENQVVSVDISWDPPIVRDGKVRLAFDRPLRRLESRVRHVWTQPPWARGAPAPFTAVGDALEITLPASPQPWLRRTLRLFLDAGPGPLGVRAV